ncbi:HPP family protein [Xanthobacter sp. TB0136]|uniref:HPP family protein n=1 Tax=Xanthobacter sp. TB0136 TaxID=3459177 RepID=UPI004039A971
MDIWNFFHRVISRWGTTEQPFLPGMIWIFTLLLGLAYLDKENIGLLLIPPFAASMTVILYLPQSPTAQPFAVVFGATIGTMIGTAACQIFGTGPLIAAASAFVALTALPKMRAYHPPGVALALFPPLFHTSIWFPITIVLPFTLVVVISASVLSRLVPSWPQYPRPLE